MGSPPEIHVLTRSAVRERLERLEELDAAVRGERWKEVHWLLDLPGKWEMSRMALDSNGLVVAFLVASLKADGAHVHRLAVDDAAQGRGLGARLLRVAAGVALGLEQRAMTISAHPSNHAAQRLYERVGFTLVGTAPQKLVFRAPTRLVAFGVQDR